MQRLLFVLRCICAICMIAMLFLLAAQVMDIYHDASFSQPMYQMDDIIGRLKMLAIPLILCISLIIILSFLHTLLSPIKSNRIPPNSRMTHQLSQEDGADCSPPAQSAISAAGRIRICLYVAAVLLIVLGVLNGGLHDVLVKAINICTECIGLG